MYINEKTVSYDSPNSQDAIGMIIQWEKSIQTNWCFHRIWPNFEANGGSL